jgi:hypothetical protein
MWQFTLFGLPQSFPLGEMQMAVELLGPFYSDFRRWHVWQAGQSARYWRFSRGVPCQCNVAPFPSALTRRAAPTPSRKSRARAETVLGLNRIGGMRQMALRLSALVLVLLGIGGGYLEYGQLGALIAVGAISTIFFAIWINLTA